MESKEFQNTVKQSVNFLENFISNAIEAMGEEATKNMMPFIYESVDFLKDHYGEMFAEE